MTFDIDANAILTVTAKDTLSNKETSIKIKNDDNRLSKEEINQICAPIMTKLYQIFILEFCNFVISNLLIINCSLRIKLRY